MPSKASVGSIARSIIPDEMNMKLKSTRSVALSFLGIPRGQIGPVLTFTCFRLPDLTIPSESLRSVPLKMAPTKKDAKEEKEAKLTPQQSADLIMDYLRKQNRPYSATDISTNLKNRVSKAAAAKLLKDMHERKEIEGRAAGKQLIYHVIQVGYMLSI